MAIGPSHKLRLSWALCRIGTTSDRMKELIESVLRDQRKSLLLSKPVYLRYSEFDLNHVQTKLGINLPTSLLSWLSGAGYGDINNELSFREEWFTVIDRGELKGHVVFAQDDVGNSYSFCPELGEIHYICRVAPEYAFLANSFGEFLRELLVRKYQLREWYENIKPQAYNW